MEKTEMARNDTFDKMSVAELTAARQRIDKLIAEKQTSARAELKDKIASMAKQHGLTLDEIFGRRGKGKGSVAPKYRDPKNPENTWTGRGRMPRWMVAAAKGGKSKDDFLI
jgi:DNA-binding protein H-NS